MPKRIGYRQLENDECVFMKRDSDSTWSHLSTHIHDIIHIASHQSLVHELKDSLIAEFGEVIYHPTADSYLGFSIQRDPMSQSFHLAQKGQITKILDQYLSGDVKRDPKDILGRHLKRSHWWIK